MPEESLFCPSLFVVHSLFLVLLPPLKSICLVLWSPSASIPQGQNPTNQGFSADSKTNEKWSLLNGKFSSAQPKRSISGNEVNADAHY